MSSVGVTEVVALEAVGVASEAEAALCFTAQDLVVQDLEVVRVLAFVVLVLDFVVRSCGSVSVGLPTRITTDILTIPIPIPIPILRMDTRTDTDSAA
jgi:hypothetical protein